jgi:hypothetical protein
MYYRGLVEIPDYDEIDWYKNSTTYKYVLKLALDQLTELGYFVEIQDKGFVIKF